MASAPILPCGAPQAECLCQCWAKQGRLIPWPLPSWGSGSQNLCEVSVFFRTSAVVVSQPPLASFGLHFPQIGKIMACNSGRQSLLDSAFPLFITHQPPPLWFSLFLSLSPPPPSTVPCPVLLKSKALYGEFITTAAIVQPSLVHLGPGLAQGFNVRLTCVCL